MLKYEVMVGVVNILPFFFEFRRHCCYGFSVPTCSTILRTFGSRKYPYPQVPHPVPKDVFLVWTLPPPLNFQLCFILTLKNAISFLRSLCPLEFQITILGVGMGVFWNHTKINSQIHNHNSQWMTSFMIKTCNLI